MADDYRLATLPRVNFCATHLEILSLQVPRKMFSDATRGLTCAGEAISRMSPASPAISIIRNESFVCPFSIALISAD